MKKWLIAVGALVVLGLILWLSLRDSRPRGAEVEVQAAEPRTISARVKATGEITPDRKVDISAKVVGEIIDLPVVEGQQVRAGQLLVQIERDLYESARDQARAALRQAEVSVRGVEIQLEDAERNLRRVRELQAQALVSQEALDAAQLAVDTARVHIDAQQQAIEQSRSALQRAEDDLARTTIRSPMDGIIIQLDAEKGETVVPGSTNLPGSVIMTVADMSTLLAEVEVSEVDVVDVALGQQAEVTVDALGTEPQRGRVAEIATSGRKDAALGTIRFRVKVALDNPHPDLRPAMTAKVAILTVTSEQALTVPIQTVVKRALGEDGKELKGSAAKGIDKKDVIYRVEDDKAQAHTVTTGISDELWVEIKDGLQEGDEVVIGPYRTLKNLHSGDAVKIGEAKEEGEDESSGEVEVTVD
jgi:HlyD family secretion protein